jgi:ribosomal protein S12 methylthiotransferase
VPDIALRTTMIVGFPGETRPAHLNMLNGIREMRFNWLGAFQDSREEDTPAGVLEGQLSRATKERRWKAVMETQAEITAEINRGRIGTRARVLVEGYDEDREQWIGRSAHEAPEVDGIVWLESDKPLQVGQFVDATITDTDVYDVIAQPR